MVLFLLFLHNSCAGPGDTGRALEAGKLIFERIPLDHRAEWAAGVLEVAYGYFAPSPEIDVVRQFAKDPSKLAKEGKWRDAQAIVDKLNDYPYLLPMPFSQTIFELATNVGKVIYTSYGYPAPFDYDAGWEIAAVLKQIVQGINDPEFESQAWSALCNEQFIQWKAPLLYRRLIDTLVFPFKARCIEAYSTSPLEVGAEVEVTKMASEENCLHELLVEIGWSEQVLMIPLAHLEPVETNDEIRALLSFNQWLYSRSFR